MGLPWRRRRAVAAVGAFLLLAGSVAAPVRSGLRQAGFEVRLRLQDGDALRAEAADLRGQVARLRRAVADAEGRAAGRQPGVTYIVVDRARNRLLLRTRDTTLRQAVCSTGSGEVLTAGGRSWQFDTPRGVFRVRQKVYLPVWIKPDWAFLEEGRRPPSRTSRQRYEEGVLGEYALVLGDGYMIHGTPYKRLLGQSVTHGCVRLDDEDLAAVHAEAAVGTPVYIF